MKEQKSNKLIIIGNVWPEPTSSAAGGRMMDLIELFQSLNYKITFACTASISEHMFPLDTIDVKIAQIKMNSSSFDDWIKMECPEIVMFDRYTVEEQFGWRVHESCPAALRILDTEDLHFLRKSREQLLKENEPFHVSKLNNSWSQREVASIYRCDLSLIISQFEFNLLTEHFNISKDLLVYLPFLYEKKMVPPSPTFEERSDFIFIGNFYHQPNWNALLYLKTKLWPEIRKQLPKSQLNIYGAYMPDKVKQLNNPQEGFNCIGRAQHSIEEISRHKVMLAPLQYGAGLKGKLFEAMLCGTPSVTTSIGAEGMTDDQLWNGSISDSTEVQTNAAVELYENKDFWLQCNKNAPKILENKFSKQKYSTEFLTRISKTIGDLSNHRSKNIMSSILFSQMHSSTKYMSKWIEEKNR